MIKNHILGVRLMLELNYDGNKILVTLGATSAELKEIWQEAGQETGACTFNVVRNYLDLCGVPYTESGVKYNQAAKLNLHYIQCCDVLVISNVEIHEDGEQLELVASSELEEIILELGGV